MKEDSLNLNCPNCKELNSLCIQSNKIFCKKKECDFTVTYCCPICDTEINDNDFQVENNAEFLHCSKCKNKISLKKIKYIFENQLFIDQEKRCTF